MPINRESQRENSKIVIKLKFFYKKCGNFQRQKIGAMTTPIAYKNK